MYVKVAYCDEQMGDFLIEVTGPIHSGLVALPYDPDAQDHDISGELRKVLDLSLSRVHVLEIEQNQTQYEANQGFVAVRYVWWEDDDGHHAVVTTRPIFVVGDNGKTIDRVR